MNTKLDEPRTAATVTTPPDGSHAHATERGASRVRRALSAVINPPEPWQRTLAATFVSALAIGAAIAEAELASVTLYSLIVGGVVLATWYAGLRFGLAATAVATALGWLFIAEPRGSLAIEGAELVKLCIGIATAAGAAWLLDSARRAKRDAEMLAEHRQTLVDEIAARESWLRTLTDSLPVLVAYIDSNERYVFNNRQYEVWFGRDRGENYGRHPREVLGDEAFERIRGYYEEALSGRQVRFETLMPLRDGGERWVSADYVPDVAPDGSVRGFFVLVADQTALKRSEQELAASEAQARGTLEAAQDGIFTIDGTGCIESFNPAAERLFGYKAQDVIGQNVSVLMPKPLRDQHPGFIEKYLATGQAAIIGTGRDVTARRKDGTLFPIRLAVSEVVLQDRRLFTGIVHDLTHRVEAEQELRLSEERYRSLAEATTSVVWVADSNAKVLEPQPDWERYTGQQWPAYRDSGFIEMVHLDDREENVRRWQSALANGTPQVFNSRVWNAPTRTWRHCETYAVPLKTESGEVREWVGATNDVEDRYQVVALEHVRVSDERTRLAESAARMGLWEWDLGTSFVWSEGLDRVYGFEAGEPLTYASVVERIHPEDRERTVKVLQAAAREQRDVDVEFRIVRMDGETRWLYSRGSMMPGSATQPARMVGVMMDTTERIETREALQQALAESSDALALVDAIIDTTPTAIVLLDHDMRFVRVNEAAAEINGLPIEDHLGRRLEDVLPVVGPAAAARYRKVWQTGQPMPVEEIPGETPAQPGVTRWWDHSAVPVHDTSGEIAAVAVIFNETTARKRAEQALRESERREHFLSDVTTELISSLDEKEVVAKVARMSVPTLADICAIRLFDESLALTAAIDGGGERERALIAAVRLRSWRAHPGSNELVGDVLARGKPLVVPEFTEEWVSACAPSDEQRSIARSVGAHSILAMPLIARGRTMGVATLVMTKSGRRFDEGDVAFTTEFAGRVSVIADNARLLSDLRDTAEDLRHANAAKDDFLGLVSHELKTPITTILGNAEVLQRLFDRLDAESRRQALGDIHTEAGRLQRLIDNMLILARLERGHRMDMEPVILPRIVDRVAEMHRRRAPDRPIKVLSEDGDGVVLASEDYVEQVVNNLLSNAEKYSPAGTLIEIAVGRKKDEVTVDVLDRGSGIAPEDAERIFEPFYRSPRTADQAQGIGVGLAVCKRVIEAQDGRLWARPRPDGGSDFGFALPVIERHDD